jgi:uncharacterized membrane protein YebE (DUF533 family)
MLKTLLAAVMSRKALGSLVLPTGLAIAVGVVAYTVVRNLRREESEEEKASRLEEARRSHEVR